MLFSYNPVMWQKEVEMQNRIHRNRLAQAKAGVDTTVSPAVMNARCEDKTRKREITKMKEEELIRKNVILLKKLSEISHRPVSQSSTIIHDRHSQNRTFVLQREYVRKQNDIANKNLKMLARIEAQRSKVDSSFVDKRAKSETGSLNSRVRLNSSKRSEIRTKRNQGTRWREGSPLQQIRFDGGLPAFSKEVENHSLTVFELNRGDQEAQELYLQRLRDWRARRPTSNTNENGTVHDHSSLSLLVRTVEKELNLRPGELP